MRVDSLDDDGVSEVTYIDDETGEFLGKFDLSDESDNGSVTEIEADFTIDEDGTGSFEVTEEEVRAEEVNENWEKLKLKEGNKSVLGGVPK
jgi:hypothetical protein